MCGVDCCSGSIVRRRGGGMLGGRGYGGGDAHAFLVVLVEAHGEQCTHFWRVLLCVEAAKPSVVIASEARGLLAWRCRGSVVRP